MEIEEHGRADPEAGLVVWPRAAQRAARERARLRRVRRNAVIKGLVGIVIGVAIFLWWSHVVAYVAFSLSGVLALAGLISPGRAYAGIGRALEAVGAVVGRALSYLVLAPMLVLVFAPLGLMLRRGRGDRLDRALDPGADSYWKDRAPVEERLDGYHNQY